MSQYSHKWSGRCWGPQLSPRSSSRPTVDSKLNSDSVRKTQLSRQSVAILQQDLAARFASIQFFSMFLQNFIQRWYYSLGTLMRTLNIEPIWSNQLDWRNSVVIWRLQSTVPEQTALSTCRAGSSFETEVTAIPFTILLLQGNCNFIINHKRYWVVRTIRNE